VLAACSVAHGATPAAVPAAQRQYAALGDSYTAGPGIPGQAGLPARCERSSRSYPALVAQVLRLNPGQVRDVSCRGAAIAGLSAPQPTGDGTNPAQLTALSAATTLVTVGIGGNDIGWAAVLTRCAELDLAPALLPGGASSDAAPCQAYFTPGGADQIQHKIQTTAGHLAGALAQIRRRAPHARIYLAGYPALLPAAGATCAHALGLTDGDLAFLNDEELRLNTMLRSAPRPGRHLRRHLHPVPRPRRLRRPACAGRDGGALAALAAGEELVAGRPPGRLLGAWPARPALTWRA